MEGPEVVITCRTVTEAGRIVGSAMYYPVSKDDTSAVVPC